jgi:hypothetical protein
MADQSKRMASVAQQPLLKGQPAVWTKDRLWKRWGSLKVERASWDSHAKELAQFLMPRSSRFFAQDRNRGGNRHNAIYDNTGVRAVRVLAAGLMSGMTSPARPWFRLETADPAMMKSEPVKVWLSTITRMMLDIFAASNTYNSLHQSYEELGVFGTASDLVVPDFQDVIRHTALTFGEYAVATNWRGEVDTLYREFQKPVGALVREFGYEACSATVQNLFDRREYDQWVTVCHAVEPRLERDDARLDKLNMPFRSCYFELEGPKEAYLRESGFRRFPNMTPRWKIVGSDIYGESPGMETLGDVKQLQHEQLRKAQGIDYQTKPPMQAPTQVKGMEIDLLPGGMSFVDSATPQGGLRPAFEVRLDLSHLLADIQDIRSRINSGFYVDLFLMLASMDMGNTRMTATEVAERHEEKLLMLGPVLERLNNELLNPLIDLTFDQIVASGALPPPPPELHGMALNVNFVSVLHQAQRAVATNSVDRFVTGLATVATMGKPEVMDRFDADDWAEWYADALGVDPSMIVADDKVAMIRQNRAAEQQRQQKMQEQMMAADGVAKLGKVPSQGGGSNLGVDAIGAFSGYQSPQAERI